MWFSKFVTKLKIFFKIIKNFNEYILITLHLNRSAECLNTLTYKILYLQQIYQLQQAGQQQIFIHSDEQADGGTDS